MKHLTLALLVILGCKGKDNDKECPPPPKVSPGVDPILVEALCALSVTPPGPGTGHTDAGVITNGKTRVPWIARDYDARFVTAKELDEDLFLLKDMSTSLFRGMMPSEFCKSTHPVMVSFILYNADNGPKHGAWIYSGELTKPEKIFVESSSTDDHAFMLAAIAPIKKALGAEAHLDFLPETESSSSPGLDGRWADVFKEH